MTDDERRYWVTLRELDDLLDAVAAFPVPVDLTFDDGFASDVEHALPRLQDRNLTATFFPCAGLLGRRGRVDTDGVRELVAAGMRLGTHGWAHRDWRRLRPEEIEEEFRRSLDVLEEVSGTTIRWAAVPFGSYDRHVLRRLTAAGMERVFTSDGGLAPRGARRIPRTSVRPGVDGDWLTQLHRRSRRHPHRVRALAARTAKGWRGGNGR